MRRVDCFKFCHELDLLELRLSILEEVVDWFVLVEATVTHSGHPKPLYYELNRKRFRRWADRIRHVVVNDIPMPPSTNFDRDRFQMDAAIRGMPALQSSDMVVIGDLDEIPRPEVMQSYRAEMGVCGLQCYNAIFYLNIENFQVPWFNPKIAPYGVLSRKTPVAIRDYDANAWGHFIPNGGWHFSYCAGASALRYKTEAYAHSNEVSGRWLDPATLKLVLQDPVKRGSVLSHYPVRYRKIDQTFPRYIRDNQMELADKGLIWRP